MNPDDVEVTDAAVIPSQRITRPRTNEQIRLRNLTNSDVNLDTVWEQEFKLSDQLTYDDHYEAYPNKKFKAIIFNNLEYVKTLCLAARTGSIIDRDDLEIQFKALNFDVQTHKEEIDGSLTKEKLFQNIEKVLSEPEKFDALAIVIMTHGNLEKLAAHDQMYEVQEIFDLFKDKVKEKPKLLILNACREEIKEIKPKQGYFSELTVENCMVVYTAYPGFLGFRKLNKGTRLIRSLRIALRMLADRKEQRLLLDLFTDIKRHVSTKPNPQNPQMPIIQHNLQKKFFIGYNEETPVEN